MRDWLLTLIRHLKYEYFLKIKQSQAWLQSLLFFIMMLLFFPMSLPASASLMREVSSGLVWIAILFMSILASEGVFQRPFDDGRLEQYLVSGRPLSAIFTAIMLTHVGFIIFPIVLLCPLIMILYGGDWSSCSVMILSLLAGAPGLISLTLLAAALNVGRVQRTTLMALILLPLTVPLMIFGSSAYALYAVQGTALPVYALLLAISLLCFMGLPFAIVGVLRLRFED